MKLNSTIQKKIETIESLSLRERILFLATIIFLMSALWKFLIFDYLSSSEDAFNKKTQELSKQLNEFETQLNNLKDAISKDNSQSIKAEINNLRKETQSLSDSITSYAKKLTTPKDMVNILDKILKENSDVKVIKMKSIEATPLFAETSKDGSPISIPLQMYLQGLELETLGIYSANLKFIEAIEQLPWKIFWDEISYDVDVYPQAKMKILVHTLSLEEGWLGV
ncbi:MAG: biosis protein MshJ [Francisellaceae bacterium]|nr:biosis protein MshJ [Francisellaceae bacterium]